jgi:hypothetical protein
VDPYMILLRLVHIVGGIVWAGATFFIYFFLLPSIRAAGPDGGKFMGTLMRVSRLTVIMPVVAIATILSGVLLLWRISGGLDAAWVMTAPGLVLTVGGLAGIAAFVGPGLRIKVAGDRMAAINQAIGAAGGAPDPAQMGELAGLQQQVGRQYQYLVILMGVSVAAMAVARYV